MLVEWARADATRVNAIREYVGLPRMMTEAEWRRRLQAENPVRVGVAVEITREMITDA